MIICKDTEQVVYERVKDIIRKSMNVSDTKASSVTMKIIRYLKADMYGKPETYKLT